MVQIDAPDFDPDIDKPNPQRAHNNTVVVSGQELFTSPEPEFIDATNTQEEASDSDQFNTGHLILKIPIGLEIPPSKFHTIYQTTLSVNNSRPPPYTTVFWMKFPH